MNDQEVNLTGMYRFTSIARPVDPAYLTNRALLIVLPVIAMLSAGVALLVDTGSGPLAAALSAALVAFVAWALTRELAPDNNGVAFIALAFAWAGNIAFDMRQVLLAFVALLLVRIVNRSTGLPARPFDTLSVFGFCTWAAINTQQPLIVLVASLAFALDALLDKPLRMHYVASAACLGVFVWMLLGDYQLIAGDQALQDWSLLGAIALGVVLIVSTCPEPVSYCDVSPQRLDRVRVNAGLVVGALLASQALLTNGRAAWLETPVWVCLVAVLLSGGFDLVKGRFGTKNVG